VIYSLRRIIDVFTNWDLGTFWNIIMWSPIFKLTGDVRNIGFAVTRDVICVEGNHHDPSVQLLLVGRETKG